MQHNKDEPIVELSQKCTVGNCLFRHAAGVINVCCMKCMLTDEWDSPAHACKGGAQMIAPFMLAETDTTIHAHRSCKLMGQTPMWCGMMTVHGCWPQMTADGNKTITTAQLVAHLANPHNPLPHEFFTQRDKPLTTTRSKPSQNMRITLNNVSETPTRTQRGVSENKHDRCSDFVVWSSGSTRSRSTLLMSLLCWPR